MRNELAIGKKSLTVQLPDEKILEVLDGGKPVCLDTDKIKGIIRDGIRQHTPADIQGKKLAIIIPDDTRLWARGDLFVPTIVKTLVTLGVSAEDICIIIALGTHDEMKEEQYAQLAGEYSKQNIRILNSANRDKDRLQYVGCTQRETEVFITSEAVEAEHIIIFGGVLHHMIAGFGGGRKYIFPGIAGYDSIQQNHSLAMEKNGLPHPMVRQSQLAGNPVNEDLTEAAEMFLQDKTCSYIGVAGNGHGEIFHAAAGPLGQTFNNCCKMLDSVCSVEVDSYGDFALISAGGALVDGQLYQAVKALFNTINVVKQGGHILFLAQCRDGVGNEIFSRTLREYRNNPAKSGQELAREFNMASYVAFRVLDLLSRYKVTLISNFSKSETNDLGFDYVDDLEEYIEGLQGKGYIIPFAENILPFVEK
jgi:nickel-dependent lactate racemase